MPLPVVRRPRWGLLIWPLVAVVGHDAADGRVCLDPATGKRRWKRGRYGHGQVLLVEVALVRIVRNDHEAAAFELSIESEKKGEDA